MVTVEQGPTQHVVLDWFHYFTQREDVLTSIMVDLTFATANLDAPLDWCTIVKIELRHPTATRWTNNPEFEVLERLEAALEDAANDYRPSLMDVLLRRSTKVHVRHVGRETAGGVRRAYFYGTAPIPASVFKKVLAAPELDDQQWSRQVTISKQKDAARSFYTGNLHPGAALRWLVLRDPQLEMRREAGDDLDVKRDVDHELSFPDEESRRRFVESLVEVSRPDYWKILLRPHASPEEPGRFRVTVTNEQSVNELWADLAVTALSSRAEAFGGEYEGWGALVITDNLKRASPA